MSTAVQGSMWHTGDTICVERQADGISSLQVQNGGVKLMGFPALVAWESCWLLLAAVIPAGRSLLERGKPASITCWQKHMGEGQISHSSLLAEACWRGANQPVSPDGRIILEKGKSPVSPAGRIILERGKPDSQHCWQNHIGEGAKQPFSPAGRSILEKGKSASKPCWQKPVGERKTNQSALLVESYWRGANHPVSPAGRRILERGKPSSQPCCDRII